MRLSFYVVMSLLFSGSFSLATEPTEETKTRLASLDGNLLGLILEHAPASTFNIFLTCKRWKERASKRADIKGSRFNIQTKRSALRQKSLKSLAVYLENEASKGFGVAIADFYRYCDFFADYIDRLEPGWKSFAFAEKTYAEVNSLTTRCQGVDKYAEKMDVFDALYKMAFIRCYYFDGNNEFNAATPAADELTDEQLKTLEQYMYVIPRPILLWNIFYQPAEGNVWRRLWAQTEELKTKPLATELKAFYPIMNTRFSNLLAVTNRHDHYIEVTQHYRFNTSAADDEAMLRYHADSPILYHAAQSLSDLGEYLKKTERREEAKRCLFLSLDKFALALEEAKMAHRDLKQKDSSPFLDTGFLQRKSDLCHQRKQAGMHLLQIFEQEKRFPETIGILNDLCSLMEDELVNRNSDGQVLEEKSMLEDYCRIWQLRIHFLFYREKYAEICNQYKALRNDFCYRFNINSDCQKVIEKAILKQNSFIYGLLQLISFKCGASTL